MKHCSEIFHHTLTGSPVSSDYTSPFVFSGKIDKVTIQLK
jgi:hypothetical protein